ncbi:hypothetical protein HanRHA438_Chr06g0285161 [Helianthus annuus]|nr:hypothetical protein HanRHA438_Chr06g0285161 [Helianthus annuus]
MEWTWVRLGGKCLGSSKTVWYWLIKGCNGGGIGISVSGSMARCWKDDDFCGPDEIPWSL